MIIIPLVPVSVYIILQQFGLLRGTSEMPRVIYVVVGMTFWQLFSSSLLQSMNAAQNEKTVLKKINMPFIVFTISAMGNVLFDYLVRVLLIWALLIGFDISFSLNWLLLPFMLLPVTLLGYSIGLFLSFFSIYFNDVRNIVDICIRYGLFASGVIFPIPKTGIISKLLSFNPIYILLENLRDILVFSRFDNFLFFIIVICVNIFFLLFVLKKLYVLEPKMREYL